MKKSFNVSPFRFQLSESLMVVCTLFLLAGCSGVPSSPSIQPQPSQISQPPASAPTQQDSIPAIDACSLLTKQEAEAALGKPVGDPKPENFPGNYSCKYESADLDNVSINVIVYNSNKDAADAFQLEIDTHNYTGVSGIGDRAIRPYPIFDIAVLKGQFELSIVIFSSTGDEESNFQKAKTLAENALTRLP